MNIYLKQSYILRKGKLAISVFLTLILLSGFSVIQDKPTRKTKILLIGDSTTEGGKPVLTNTIEQMIAGEDSNLPVEFAKLARNFVDV